MGTRADFYLGRGPDAAWLASISWDGYPGGIDDAVLRATTPAAYGEALADFLARRDDVTWAVEPWPWPWETSTTTDYAYALDVAEKRVFASSFGHAWFPVDPDAENCGEPEDEDSAIPRDAVFPDMTSRKGDLAHIMGRSGLIVATSTDDVNVSSIGTPKTSPAPPVAEQGQKFLADTCVAAERERLGGLCCDNPHPTEESAEPNNEALCGNCGAAMDTDMLEKLRYRASTGSESDAVLESVNDQFERDLNAAVAGFLADPKVRPEVELPAGPGESGYDPEVFEAAVRAKHQREEMMSDPAIEAAALEGFEGNPTAKAYAMGFAAGAASAEAAPATPARGVMDELDDLAAWCAARGDDLTDVVAEIRRRRAKAETVQRLTDEHA